MEPLDLYKTPLNGVNLIEASAGTGKTFTITGLYLRLIVELGLGVEQILVVTYTKAATAELRERIRTKLVETRLALAQNSEEEPFTQALERAGIARQQAGTRLQHAILSFDRAGIFTIHGFCQRVLTDNAFSSGLPFEMELLTDESALIQQVVDDFWAQRIQQLSSGMVDFLLEQHYTPELLVQFLRGKLGKPYVELRGCPETVDPAELEQAYIEAFDAARALWLEENKIISRLLLESTGLNGNRYRKAFIPNWLTAMALYLTETPGPWFDAFEKFASNTLAKAVNKGGCAPQHPFFDSCQRLLEVRTALLENYRRSQVRLLQELIEFTDTQLTKCKSEQRLLSYDDLLLKLQSALTGVAGEMLAAAIRESYRAALIDEFQDTDPVQYAIFRRIYQSGDAPVFLVGDPKQAIYSFRGADIFAYLKAARDALSRYSLKYNWRSTPALLCGINKLFNQQHNSFIYSEILYSGVTAAASGMAQLIDDVADGGALRIGLLEGNPTKEQALELSVHTAAAEVRRLIRQGAKGSLRIGNRPLVGGDIALLVRTHRQGERIKHALNLLGISSVRSAQADVFHSESAIQLERLLKAVLQPAREALVRAALTTELLGIDGNRLASMTETDLEGLMSAFQAYHQRWREQGFMRMFRQLLSEQAVPVRLLQRENGERQLTDLLHLAELLHQHEVEGRPGMELLLSWFSQRRQAETMESEASQLRLESDDQLVQIVTIHKSKGLQYPIVFYPFGWESGATKIGPGSAYLFHDPQRGYQPQLDLGSAAWKNDLWLAHNEALAESVRQLYVALTRAQYRCYLYWGGVSGAGCTPLAWLLHPPPEPREGDLLGALTNAFSRLQETEIRARIERLVADSEGAISLHRCTPLDDTAPLEAAPHELPSLRARVFHRQLHNNRRMTSFSALANRHASIELPDHDSGDHGEAAALGSFETASTEELDIFRFPRGARAGSALHAVFERLDFTTCTRMQLASLVEDQLAGHGIDAQWCQVVCAMVERVLDAPLDPAQEIYLRQVAVEHRLVELGFYFPIDRINGAGLSRLLLQHGFAGDEVLRQALQRLDFSDIQGFMKGFIDLVFESGGRFYLLDYKSNWLGDRLSDYGRPQMAQAMTRERYYLQYLLYTLALHRYLRNRISGYSYDAHFGAVIYLFLRGVAADGGAGTGIYYDRPDVALIEALDRYFGESQGAAA
ncbi:MAG: exodeoxyribonuclease V subunit beta [Chromatiaceae bacterium]|nr:exodeoxyribonuclease V subunit beta [Chromatiaceae bacterium]